MSATPTYNLPPCPVCSTKKFVQRPCWKFAHNTSAARKKNVYSLAGCTHVAGAVNVDKLRDDPDDWALIEEQWQIAALALFEEKTLRWDPESREAFRIILEEREKLPDPPQPFALTAEIQLQPEPNEQTK